MTEIKIETHDVGSGQPVSEPPVITGPQEQLESPVDELLDGQRWTTVAEMGDVLPLAAGPDRTFSFKKQSLSTAMQVAQQTPADAQGKPYLRVVFQLAGLVDTLQGVRHPTIDETALALRRLPLFSIIHMLCRLALRNGRGTVRQEVRCPSIRCGEQQDVPVSLGAVRVRDWGIRTAVPAVDFSLADPVEWPAGKRTTVVTIEPAPYDALCGLSSGAANSRVEVTAATLARSVVGTDAVQGRINLPVQAIGLLAQQDYLDLDLEHDLVSGGPLMVGEAQCQRCGDKMWVPIPLSVLTFFEAPSAGGRSSRRRLHR